MSNELQIFNYQNNEVRVVEKDGEPWFVAKDVCDILELTNAREAITALDDDEKNSVRISDGIQGRGNPNMNVISEPGLYKLAFRSNKPEAKNFVRWVTHEVLPSIRKTGMYATPQTVDAYKGGNSFAFLPDFRPIFLYRN